VSKISDTCHLSSSLALDFYQKLEIIAPFTIKSVKTDNGLEFLGEFDNYLQKKNITHYFSYPRTPKSNAFIERFNRTIQEEFVDKNNEHLTDPTIFNQKLMNYLLYYNTIRPHQSLGYLTPMAFMLEKDLKSNMLWTSTTNCILYEI
jgi:transposase InsO family protein